MRYQRKVLLMIIFVQFILASNTLLYAGETDMKKYVRYEFSDKWVTKTELKAIALITPDALDGWITLLPEESLLLNIDVGEFVNDVGLYNISIDYYQSIILSESGKKPRYTEQNIWNSNQIEIAIIENKP